MTRCLPVVALLLLLSSCSLFSYHPYELGSTPGPSEANLKAEDRQPLDGSAKDRMFIGIAMSGGGSRAANFAAATLLQLRTLGLLDRADALSSVSGGSMPAIYYALEGHEYFSLVPFGTQRIAFTEQEVKERFSPHYQLRFALRWLLPQNIVLYWLSSYNRTEIMFDVFDANLFHGATYADLKQGKGPKLLVNATDRDDLEHFILSDTISLPYGLADLPYKRFVFADERVPGADLKPLPLSVAMASSSAVPGLLQNVTLANPKSQPSGPQTYYHLMDGMLADNSGLLTLLDLLQQAVKDGTFDREFPDGCRVIYIDAAPQFPNWAREVDDTRGWKDYLLDRNLADAVDYILLPQREQALGLMGLRPEDIRNDVAVSSFAIAPNAPGDRKEKTCSFWHIALRHVKPDPAKPPLWIPTEWDISDEQQAFLYEAACKAVKRGWDAGARNWFGTPGRTVGC